MIYGLRSSPFITFSICCNLKRDGHTKNYDGGIHLVIYTKKNKNNKPDIKPARISDHDSTALNCSTRIGTKS